MRVAVLGTGVVGRTLGTKLVELGHEVKMGSRTPDNAPAAEWVASAGDAAGQGTFADAAAFGELVLNCTGGAVALEALTAAGGDNLEGKTVLDVSNPLDFSRGRPPTLTVCNTDSVGEQIQRTFPGARVVKGLNTMNCGVMVEPSLVPGEHDVLICGDDESAKSEVSELLRSFGWPAERILDLGDITSARGLEMCVALWLRLAAAFGTHVNIHVAR
ncbi:MAG TPA: NAD(P)-binding domain-containing protein [Gaiellaceae bacterium]|nr:NAD(P)-binding domain-containing protein [Gaiellaceae bacterium]